MNNDITILYYTSNQIDDEAAERVRADLIVKAGGTRIVSVSQKPINFGDNICIGEVGVSLHNLFKQALIGAKEIKTKYMLCAEDDYLYGASRFTFVFPRDDTFYYDENRWGLTRDGRFFWRPRTIFGMCMTSTQLMVDTLEKRLEKHSDPNTPYLKYFSEPGKYEEHLRLASVRMERVNTDIPTITFNHHKSMGKRRMVRKDDIVKYELPHWGNGADLWKKFLGDEK